MMQRFVDTVLGVAKESTKTFCQESFNNFVKVVNGFSAVVLAVLPGKSGAVEDVTGWELRPTFRAPNIPQWMEKRASSFNRYIHEFDYEGTDSDDPDNAADYYDSDSSSPPSPSSSSSRPSRSNSGSRLGQQKRSLIALIIWKLTWPFRWLLNKLFGRRRQASGPSPQNSDMLSRSSSSEKFKSMYSFASKHFSGVKDHLAHRATDSRRRGVIEDMQLGVELFIERVFEVVRQGIFYVISPFQTLKFVLRKMFFPGSSRETQTVVNKATLGDSDPGTKYERRLRYKLNTDARTCGDYITALGYPYESLKVTTGDGYIIRLERIPRPESKKVLYLQHGILDSSLGWVSNGVVGSQAFAAYDQGYDVFLGNLRGLVSREHINPHISKQSYWRYTVNEHGTQDIPAMLEKVHEIKMSELKQLNLLSDDEKSNEETGTTPASSSGRSLPYSLCGVSHSLGGASMIIYLVIRRLEGKPHYMKRVVLLSPAGFHEKAPSSSPLIRFVLHSFQPLLRPIFPGFYIPTQFLRMLFNKLSRDFQNYPAVGGLVQILISFVTGGDTSNWVGALGMSHYNMEDMPGIAYGVALHLTQMNRSKRFQLYDFGERGNLKAYGTKEPLDIGAHYGQVDIPVDVVAGLKDKLIPPSMTRKHYETFKEAGCEVSYAEFDYAHLDFTFSHREELLDYVMSRLLTVQPKQSRRKRLTKRSSSDNDRAMKMKSVQNENSYHRSATCVELRNGRADEEDWTMVGVK